MEKLPEVRDPEPEKQDSDTKLGTYTTYLIAQFKSRWGNSCGLAGHEKRPTRKQSNKSNGVAERLTPMAT